MELDAMDMGGVIREYRAHPWHGPYPLPQARVAGWGNVSQGQLSRLENGRSKVADLGRLVSWAHALKIPEPLLWFYVPAHAENSRKPAGVRAVAPSLLVRRVEPQIAAHVRSLLREYAATDNLAGPRPLLQTVPTHLVHLERLLTDTSGSVRRDLLRTAARTAEFSGWLFQDAGDLGSATRYTDRALRYCHELGDRNLISHALMRQSNIAGDGGDAERTLDFAMAALRDWDYLTPGMRAVTLRQEAAGHTMQNNSAAAERAIERGLEQVIVRVPGGEPDDLTGYCTPSYLEMEAATCWVHLGRPESAVEALERGLSAWQAEFRRDLGLCLARAARAYAAVGDSDQAYGAAENALIIASETKSARIVRELRQAQRALTQHGMPTVAAEVDHGLRQLAVSRS